MPPAVDIGVALIFGNIPLSLGDESNSQPAPLIRIYRSLERRFKCDFNYFENMKALIIYFTMGGRTKKMAEAITESLVNYEIEYFPIELTGSFIEKLKVLDKFENNDYSSIEKELSTLDAAPYDLLVFGMPTYGNKPPKAFNEILSRLGNLDGKNAVVFVTSRITGGGARDYMADELGAKGANIVEKAKFRGFFYLRTKAAKELGTKVFQKIQ